MNIINQLIIKHYSLKLNDNAYQMDHFQKIITISINSLIH